MPATYTQAQQQSLDRVVEGLKTAGYTQDLVKRNYRYDDWYESGTPERIIQAAAFARKPFAYDTACFGVVASNGSGSIDLIRQVRALGAPRSFEVKPDGTVMHWRVSQNPTENDRQEKIPANQLAATFASRVARWSPDAILTQRMHSATKQLDFYDAWLIPNLEEHIIAKLGPQLENLLQKCVSETLERTNHAPNWEVLFRLLFRGIAGKVLRDRAHNNFKGFSINSEPEDLFRSVTEHYGEHPVLGEKVTKKLIYQSLWSGFNLRHLSVDVLTYLYEGFLVTKELRKVHGIHATRPSVARYVVGKLPLEEVDEGRTVLEPCCGGGSFLVASLQRFRQLLPRNTSATARHGHARSRLVGVDRDPFALEVARCSLMLSDYPNRNGWRLAQEDVFGGQDVSPLYHEALKQAKIVLCNPPFEGLDKKQVATHSASTPRTPADILRRVLSEVPLDACFGLILPTAAVDGPSYAPLRRQLVERFDTLEMVHLPDNAFRHAQVKTVLLVAKHPKSGPAATTVAYGTVRDIDVFERSGTPVDKFSATRSVTEATQTLDATRFWRVWESLGVTRGDKLLTCRAGVEWKTSLPVAKRVSASPLTGYRPGYHPTNPIACYEAPGLVYLNAASASQEWKAWGLPWHLPKVFLNRIRTSRDPWRLAAFPVSEDFACSENFIAVWPPAGWSANSLAAVLNGPLASAFVDTHDRDKHTKISTVSGMPLPTLTKTEKDKLDELVAAYMDAVVSYRREKLEHAERTSAELAGGLFGDREVVGHAPSASHLASMIIDIDAAVLAGYSLPPPLERDVLNYLRFAKRPLPFGFPDYAETMIRRRLKDQTACLSEDAEEQQTTWAAFEKMSEVGRVLLRTPHG